MQLYGALSSRRGGGTEKGSSLGSAITQTQLRSGGHKEKETTQEWHERLKVIVMANTTGQWRNALCDCYGRHRRPGALSNWLPAMAHVSRQQVQLSPKQNVITVRCAGGRSTAEAHHICGVSEGKRVSSNLTDKCVFFQTTFFNMATFINRFEMSNFILSHKKVKFPKTTHFIKAE